jgi:hypothetical protein
VITACHMLRSWQVRRCKAGITDPVTGNLVPAPYMPRVAELSADWRCFSTTQKLEHVLGMKLHRATEILMWPLAESRSAATVDGRRCGASCMFGVRAMLDSAPEQERCRGATASAASKNAPASLAPVPRHSRVRGNPRRAGVGCAKEPINSF